tara:strand:+ start:6417 stop:6836 length:420 start_codon:yes stop_codon:yes gene_type:complete
VSEFGAIIERLEIHWRTADAAIPAGTNGFERDVRLAADLTAGELPHVFAHDPNESSSRLPLRQSDRAVSIQFDYWTRGASQEAVALVLDAFRDQVEADPTLDGIVEDAYVSTRAVVDAQFAGKAERVGVVLVNTQKVAD